MPQFDATTFLPQIFWLAIIFGALYGAAVWGIVPWVQRILDIRARHLERELQHAQELLDHAEAVRGEMDAALAAASFQARAEFDAAIAAATAETEQAFERLSDEMRAQLAAMEAESRAREALDAAALPALAEQITRDVVKKLTGEAPAPAALEAAVGEAQQAMNQEQRSC